MGATCGYSSAACGTDIISLKQWLRGGNLCISTFFKETIHTSVVRGGGDWVALEKVLDDATSVHYVTNEGYYGDGVIFVL